ncbi:MAG: hypothetical protein HY553_14080 [Elusimicrobia bacterium]|nr:hypothetical protein [Elusimicrobiota bacterium]
MPPGLAGTLLAAFLAALAGVAGAQTAQVDCEGTVGALRYSHPSLRCSCRSSDEMPDCSDGGGSSGSASAPRGGGGHRSSGPSLESQLMATAMSAFLNAFMTSMLTPRGPSAAELRAEAERKWAEYERLRRDAEKRRAEEAFGARKDDALALLGGRPAPPPSSIRENGTPALLRGEWKKGVQTPGLSQQDRSRLRLRLPLDESAAAAVDLERVLKVREELSGPAAPPRISPALALVEGSITYGVGAAVEQGAESLLVRAYGDGRALPFGDAYALGGVAMALTKGNKEEAAPPAVNWALGKIPGAGLAVGTAQGVAAVTTTVFRRSWDQFLEESEKVVPGVLPEGGAKAFWSGMKDDLSTGQKAVFEVLGL